MTDARVAIVTGSGKGIGRAIAERLARDGYNVVVNYRSDAASGHDTLTAIQAVSPDSISVQADVASPEGAHDLVEQAHKQFGRLDVLVNNAGPFLAKPVFETRIEEW